jgi:hypothetical protein
MLKTFVIVATITLGGLIIGDNLVPDCCAVEPNAPSYAICDTDSQEVLKSHCQTAPYIVRDARETRRNNRAARPMWYPGKRLFSYIRNRVAD